MSAYRALSPRSSRLARNRSVCFLNFLASNERRVLARRPMVRMNHISMVTGSKLPDRFV